MTIREIEALSGMTRANIRFYESEGLLTPNRMENGYRDYTRSDLDTLHKIRLLRALGLGIDEIRKLSAGETALGEALESRLSAMQTEQRTLVRAEEVARAMLRAHADYATLDTGRYLAALEAGAQTAVQQDVQPKQHMLWQRFFARLIWTLRCITRSGSRCFRCLDTICSGTETAARCWCRFYHF